jgi:hypothetical protein
MGRLIAVLVIAAGLAVSAGAAVSPYLIRSDQYIGNFAVKKNGTLGGVIRAYGKPSELRRTKDGCLGLWPSVGLSVFFYNLVDKNPCKPATGFFSDALMTRDPWRTSNGLRMGDTLARLKQLYPKAERHGSSQWLVIRFTQATGRYPGLAAKLVGGRITAFEVLYQAGGE